AGLEGAAAQHKSAPAPVRRGAPRVRAQRVAQGCASGENVSERLVMRIAQIAPLTEAVPPKLYGGTERIVSYLTEELVALGHDVTLFASGDSMTAANLVPCVPKALRLDANVIDTIPYYMLMLDRVRQRADDFDVMHFHIDQFQFP